MGKDTSRFEVDAEDLEIESAPEETTETLEPATDEEIAFWLTPEAWIDEEDEEDT
jgi:hypothetical protein